VKGHTNKDLRDVVLDYILSERPNSAHIESQTSLIEAGILDSMLLLKLVEFLEEQFAISIGSDEITPENFEAVDDIVRLIRGKQVGPGSGWHPAGVDSRANMSTLDLRATPRYAVGLY
jgi:acyl carrier protein